MSRNLHLPHSVCTPTLFLEILRAKTRRGTFIQSNRFSMTLIELSLVSTTLSSTMSDSCSSCSSEQESDSSKVSDFRKRAWSQSSESAKDRVKT